MEALKETQKLPFYIEEFDNVVWGSPKANRFWPLYDSFIGKNKP